MSDGWGSDDAGWGATDTAASSDGWGGNTGDSNNNVSDKSCRICKEEVCIEFITKSSIIDLKRGTN